MRPEFIVMAAYWAFGIWIYSMGAKGKRGALKKDGAHVITVFPTRKTDAEQYGDAYQAFHKRIMILSVVMGVACAIVGRLLPIIFSSLAFFAYLNFYKYQTEEKLREICSGGKVG